MRPLTTYESTTADRAGPSQAHCPCCPPLRPHLFVHGEGIPLTNVAEIDELEAPRNRAKIDIQVGLREVPDALPYSVLQRNEVVGVRGTESRVGYDLRTPARCDE